MAVSSGALVTLAEVEAYLPLSGAGHRPMVERFIDHWSNQLQRAFGRRWVYRAPAEVDGAANIVASTALAAGALTLAAQPDSEGRTLIVTITDDNLSLTSVTVTIVGTVAGASKTVVLTMSATGQLVFHVPYFFTALSSITVGTPSGTVTNDTIKVGSSLGYVEFYSPRYNDRSPHRLRTRAFPIIESVEANEDAQREYGAATALTLNTGYEVSRGDTIVRISARLPMSWGCGYRTVKHRYSGGYFGAANVPGHVKEVVLELVAWAYRYATTGRQGMASGSDGTGSWVLQGPPLITSGMRDRLASEMPFRFDELPEWDFDQEAA